ncbi:GNAT family N-acetyltransferase [Streptomyces sp. SP18CS02]|uniref:GNAT family N-acetyltransferase n=1 Tax=Streptomyces sp. SP18CS02 TaxID=3002531 RepID=UPI002E7831D6|nr:GNAT family N-acetyltransferase [Streptomyces sp. SP18CS02]MEE1754615.1 GNAT family N-acetyltransferase [Streptomyces sp. SP18CS02]
METSETCEILQIARPHEVTPGLGQQLTECWTTVSNAGGAVIAAEFPLPPLTTRDVAPVVRQLVEGLDPRRGRLLVATTEGELAGWLVLRRDPHPLVAHCGVVNHLQTHTRFRGRGFGAALMHRVHHIAREEMGLERLNLTARDGLGLEDFYRRLGWVETGRRPGVLRVAPGDDRDEILMSRTL